MHCSRSVHGSILAAVVDVHSQKKRHFITNDDITDWSSFQVLQALFMFRKMSMAVSFNKPSVRGYLHAQTIDHLHSFELPVVMFYLIPVESRECVRPLTCPSSVPHVPVPPLPFASCPSKVALSASLRHDTSTVWLRQCQSRTQGPPTRCTKMERQCWRCWTGVAELHHSHRSRRHSWTSYCALWSRR